MANELYYLSKGSSVRRKQFVITSLITLLLLFFVVPSVMFAQVSSGSTLRGVVKDPNGALVANATVTLINTQRGDERQTKTNDEGAFVFTAITSGSYKLKVEASGFKTADLDAFNIAPSATFNQEVTLEVGAESQTVTVTQDAAPIKTDTGERSETITAKQLDNLSIIGRSSLELLRILPGVVAPDPGEGNLDTVSFGGGGNANANYYVNGIRGVNNNVSIDGSRIMDIGANNGTIITANNDMVQEVTVKSSNYAAEYGSSGVQIIATTKSGSKDFHGQLYDYIRLRQFQASDRSNTIARSPRPNTKFQFIGGNIGGPILLPFTDFNRGRDRLFFFVGFEAQRQTRDPGTKLGTVPTQAERNGDFSRSVSGRPNGVFCPPDTLQFNDCTPVPNGNFTSYVNPLGRALMNMFPLPNFTPVPGGGQDRFNYASAITAPQNRTDLKMRFDLKATDNTNVYLRLARESESDDSPYGIWWGPSTFELPSHLVGGNLGRSAAVNITSVLNPTMTNEMVISASKLRLDYDFADPSKVSKEALGLQNLQLPWGARANTPYAPLALISWDVNSQLWEPGGIPLFAINDSFSLNDTVSKVYNNHTLKFGGLIEQANKKQNTQGTPEGQIEYEGMNQAKTTGNAFANLYTGRINGIDQTTTIPSGHWRFYNFEAFAQDSWKVKPNVTIEYGVRFSYFTNNTERVGYGVVFSPAAYIRGAGPYLNGNLDRPNGMLQAKLGDIPKSIFADNPAPKFSPRLNIAWDVFKDGSTVVRGGAGLFHNRVQGNYQYGSISSPPNTLSVHADSWGAPNNDITLNNLSSFNPATLAPGASCRAAGNCPSINTPDLNSNHIPRIFTASLSIARRLPFQNVLEVAYVGTFGRHLPQTLSVNFVTQPKLTGMLGNADLSNPLHRAAVGNTAAALGVLVPYPDYNDVKFGEYVGTSNYHSMQVTLNRQLGKDLQYFFTYTFSKALGTTSTNESDGADQIDPIDTRGRSYGVLRYDRTHIFNVSYNYNFPDLARGKFKNWFTKALFNGWQMSGITTVQSGRPIRLRFTGAIVNNSTLFSYFGTNGNTPSQGATSAIAPILLRDPQTGSTKVGSSYLDLSAIQIPGFGQTGAYQGPFYIRSPRTSNFDVTFFKNFTIKEEMKLQFRAGLFNVFNQAFPNPDQGDINTTLNTECITQAPAGIPNGIGGTTTDPICDPRGGFRFTADTVRDFGRVISKRGHRRVEFAIKFYF